MLIGKELQDEIIDVCLPAVAPSLSDRGHPATLKRLAASSQLAQYPHHAMTVADRQ
jgi:hypothetical protein